MTLVYVISLEADVERRERLLQDLRAVRDVWPVVITGLPGSTLCDTARTALTDNGGDQPGKGTLGCFLSHVSAWEQVARGSTAAVILEDDVVLDGFEAVHGLCVPADAGLVFINERMCLRVSSPGQPPALEPISSLLRRLDLTRALGGDGYILRPAAARSLLDACARDLFYGHVDGRLLRYSTTEDELHALPRDSWIGSVIRDHHNPRRPPGLSVVKGYCLTRPLVRHSAAESSREREDRADAVVGTDGLGTGASS